MDTSPKESAGGAPREDSGPPWSKILQAALPRKFAVASVYLLKGDVEVTLASEEPPP